MIYKIAASARIGGTLILIGRSTENLNLHMSPPIADVGVRRDATEFVVPVQLASRRLAQKAEMERIVYDLSQK